MPVSTQHEEYKKMAPEWARVKACASGAREVKKLGTAILPPPDLREDGSYSKPRYHSYSLRAIYTNYTGRTKSGLSGACFRKMPENDFPVGLDYLVQDADGSGQSVNQLAKEAIAAMFVTGRPIILVDYPAIMEGMTAAQIKAVDAKARLKPYCAEDLINWKTEVRGGKTVLTQARLRESYDESTDEFDSAPMEQIRVLRLRDKGYTQQVYRDDKPYDEEVIIKNAKGQAFDYITLFVAGSQNNDLSVDEIPLADIAHVNMGHYRNSADMEDSAFLCGQPMLHIDIGEMDGKEWTESNPNGIEIGSKRGIQTRKGRIEMVQAEERNIYTGLMEAKEKQMVALGAKIVENRDTQETATAAKIDATGENSVLADIVTNVEEMFQWCIEVAGEFMGVEVDGKEAFTMNREFFPESADPQMVSAGIMLYDRGASALSDLRALGRTASLIAQDRTDDDIDAENSSVSPIAGPNSNQAAPVDR